MTNTTLRDRFGIDAKNSSIASKIINLTIEDGKIAIYDENVGAGVMPARRVMICVCFIGLRPGYSGGIFRPSLDERKGGKRRSNLHRERRCLSGHPFRRGG